MPAYLISYDLRRPDRHYEKLSEAMRRLGPWCHCLESNWIVVTDLGAVEVRDALIDSIDTNDDLIVMEVAGPWASYGLRKDCLDWLKENL
ncbi:MAG: SinR family protein [Deltaproteobacteria bacterium]|nr:SinR family protein [Deltaproteobacteria bacterium]